MTGVEVGVTDATNAICVCGVGIAKLMPLELVGAVTARLPGVVVGAGRGTDSGSAPALSPPLPYPALGPSSLARALPPATVAATRGRAEWQDKRQERDGVCVCLCVCEKGGG